ncbi:UDP-GlcNAc--UDP-phosphate GlcNAc-1-phosphate transferase [Sphingobacterium sp. UBA6645]|uniref:UDP-GlcNAc--UDP-phosphate GlcNAc-1-phosphate transferase n=1 Tax=Sphingobacterium sp. UBA6645 TaxID=1947511 RepID=UPI0025DFDC8D|nr:UDP-GlcNAc--UDP-phosphate GlcNAc-1-phosphate transferase [Sphingobacterium sp. UBA6645]
MIYFFVLIALLTLEFLYFKVADKFGIIDKPNFRSSHSKSTVRGGGVIFYFGALFFFLYSGFQYPWFFFGLTLMTIISFVDDMFSLSNKLRITIHFVSVILLSIQLNLFQMDWYYLIVTFIVVVGVINAYNFMDGINGITFCYSFAVGLLLSIMNHQIDFVSQDLLTFTLIALLVFAFFNFRQNARTFAGDVGSVSIAFILMFCLGLLIIKTGDLIYILFLLIYGLDSIWTIVLRLKNRENIFKPHRSHLYQYLANEAGVNKLVVSSIYGVTQFILGLLIIKVAKVDSILKWQFSICFVVVLSVFYLILKGYILRKYVKIKNSNV